VNDVKKRAVWKQNAISIGRIMRYMSTTDLRRRKQKWSKVSLLISHIKNFIINLFCKNTRKYFFFGGGVSHLFPYLQISEAEDILNLFVCARPNAWSFYSTRVWEVVVNSTNKLWSMERRQTARKWTPPVWSSQQFRSPQIEDDIQMENQSTF